MSSAEALELENEVGFQDEGELLSSEFEIPATNPHLEQVFGSRPATGTARYFALYIVGTGEFIIREVGAGKILRTFNTGIGSERNWVFQALVAADQNRPIVRELLSLKSIQAAIANISRAAVSQAMALLGPATSVSEGPFGAH